MAQAVCHQPITTEAWIKPQASSSRIFTQRGSVEVSLQGKGYVPSVT
jgi:hypothetical protein